MQRESVEEIILEAIRNTNAAREAAEQLEVTPTAPLFGPDSSLDSMGLVARRIDVEEALLDAGVEVSLSDERAMAQERNPFASVPALVDYVLESVAAPQ